MARELIWLLCTIWGFLYALGGYRHKNWRRLGIPLSLLGAGLLFNLLSWQLFCSALLIGLFLRLPFTLIGDSINASPWNWIWIWVLGGLYGIPALVLQLNLQAVAVPLIVVGILGTASNLPMLSRMAPWKFCEVCFGTSLAYPFCMALSSF